MIRITSKVEGFRRGGIRHSKTGVEYPDDRFSDAELQLLQAEPMLRIEVVEEKASAYKGLNAKEAIKLVEETDDLHLLDTLEAGEERKSVLDAIAERRKELE